MISIIIPAHNEYRNLKNLLPRLDTITSGFKDTEVILSLSAATVDQTLDLVSQPSIRLVKCKSTGRAKQLNAGAAMSSGRVLVFLHADVIPPNGFLSDIRETLSKGFKAGFFSYKFDTNHWLLRINSSFTGRDGLFTGGGDQCLFIEKEVFNQLGGYNEEQVLMEDFEFFRRMKKQKIPYRIVNNDLVVSARKYQYNSYWRVNLSNLILLVLFRMGYPASRLRALHQKLIRLPYSKT